MLETWSLFLMVSCGLLGLLDGSRPFIFSLVKTEDTFPDSTTLLCFCETHAHHAKENSFWYCFSLQLETLVPFVWEVCFFGPLWVRIPTYQPFLIVLGPGAIFRTPIWTWSREIESVCLPFLTCGPEGWVCCFCTAVWRDNNCFE